MPLASGGGSVLPRPLQLRTGCNIDAAGGDACVACMARLLELAIGRRPTAVNGLLARDRIAWRSVEALARVEGEGVILESVPRVQVDAVL